MSPTTRVSGGLLLVLVLTLHACMVPPNGPYSSLPLFTSSPLFAPNDRQVAPYQALAREQDQSLGTCAETHTCDRAHYTRALLALYESQAVAAKHFQDVIDAAPKSPLASSSHFWLKLLQSPPTFLNHTRSYANATEHLVRDLLELETSAAQVMQREVKARDKKVEDLTTQLETLKRKVEELTAQLEALKRIDQEMKEMTRPVKPPLKPPQPPEKGAQP
jgi:TolA-binding protein